MMLRIPFRALLLSCCCFTGLAASALLGCSSDSSDGTDDADPDRVDCQEFCKYQLGCDNDSQSTCVTTCAFARSYCEEPGQAFALCIRDRPSSDFRCNDQGHTEPKDGVCPSELEELEDCIKRTLGQ